MTNNQWLAAQIKWRKLSRGWVAQQLKVDRSTVDRWLQPRTKKGKPNPSWRFMPNMACALLAYVLADEKVSKEC